MYREIQHNQHRYLGWLQWVFAAITLGQLAAFAALEVGLGWLPFGPAIHLLILGIAGMLWLALANGHLSLRVSTKGWDLRYFPFQLYQRHIAWQEIKNVSLIDPGELPDNAQFGFPGKDFTNTYLLTNQHYKVLRIDLVTGGKVFVSTSQPKELLNFLQKSVYLSV